MRRENAGRTGYSWSVIMTATAGINQAPLYWAMGKKGRLTCKLLCTSPVVYVRCIVVLLDSLTCTLRRAFGDRLGEKRQEFTDRTLLIKGKGGKVRSLT